MSYCTDQNLIYWFGEPELIQLTDREQLGSIDYAIIDNAITAADAEINGYLTAYPLPLAIVPANFERLACDIAHYYLYNNEPVPHVVERYKSAIRYLEKIADNKITLGPDLTGTTPASADGVEFSSTDSVFSRSALNDF